MKEISLESGLTDPDEVSSEETGQAESLPFSDEEARQVTVITLMRIYDMLGMILTHLDQDAADAVAQAHAEGRIVGPLPSLNI